MDLKEQESGVDPSRHWYYQSKKVPLVRFFKKLATQQKEKLTVIDFGSGSGFFAYELYRSFPDQIEAVLLVDIGYTEEELENTRTAPVKKLHAIPEGIDNCVVIMMDVLEHIEDDYAIIEDMSRRVGKNSFFFITVPAFMSVWSAHDEYLGHFRRYTLPMLAKLMLSQDCRLDERYYIFAGLFPFAWLIRRLKRNKAATTDLKSSDMAPLPGFPNAVLKQYNTFEMNFRKLNRLFGLTCVAEGKFPE